MVGQEHVLQALINALDRDRLHHAYLFTGTRGVGKTTIARILAKCLNCEVGVSSVPCNECSACTEINEGRFVDLIEVDAASRTKVEDTRELLDNVQYAPTRGRYKVYLIDEVHMLSNSSFNALLKTLEEPPPHVKFLLATTDPQKLPVTILSRCLQFNLKNMNPERIVSHLQFVLDKEMVPFDDAGLWQLARSADGSMRDALSLTDQSIAFGDGKITDADVRVMLGTIDQSLVYDVLKGLIAEDVQQLLTAVASLSEHSPDYSAALAELIATLHRIAIAQALPEAVDNSQGDRQQIYDFAQVISTEDVQLYYQIALLGRRDLPLVPDPRSGFEMVLLRMLAFKPQGVNHLPKVTLVAEKIDEDVNTTIVNDVTVTSEVTAEVTIAPQVTAPIPVESVSAEHTQTQTQTQTHAESIKAESTGLADTSSLSRTDNSPVNHSANESNSIESSSVESNSIENNGAIPSEYESFASMSESSVETSDRGEPSVKKSDAVTEVAVENESDIGAEHQKKYGPGYEQRHELESKTPEEQVFERKVHDKDDVADLVDETTPDDDDTFIGDAAKKRVPKISFSEFNSDNWFTVYKSIETGGLLQSTVANCALISWDSLHLHYILDHQQSTLYDTRHQQYLAELLSEYFGHAIEVTITLGDVPHETPSKIVIRQRKERQIQAEDAIANDPVVQQLQEMVGGHVVPDSINPID
jgi:DNA polymerase-3 subunit gamma/tau